MQKPTQKLRLGDRINRALGGLVLLGNAGAVDTTRDVISNGDGGHGKHGTTTAPPTDFQPLALEWAEFFRRAVEMAELDLAMERGEVERPTETRRGQVSAEAGRQRRRRIAKATVYQGRRPEFVAYVEGCSVSLVRTERIAAKLDPLTGQRAERPLTAPPPRS